MSKRGQKELLLDIKEAILRINAYLKDLDINDFYDDLKTQDAITRNIEIIGEASKMINEEIKNKDKSIEWSYMAKTRDRLIHHYFGINLDIIWGICKTDLPALLLKIDSLIEKL